MCATSVCEDTKLLELRQCTGVNGSKFPYLRRALWGQGAHRLQLGAPRPTRSETDLTDTWVTGNVCFKCTSKTKYH